VELFYEVKKSKKAEKTIFRCKKLGGEASIKKVSTSPIFRGPAGSDHRGKRGMEGPTKWRTNQLLTLKINEVQKSKPVVKAALTQLFAIIRKGKVVWKVPECEKGWKTGSPN